MSRRSCACRADSRYIEPAVRLLLALVLVCAGACGDERAPRAARGMSQADYDAWRQPERLVASLLLEPGQRVADIGAGRGYLTLRLAEAVGPRGKVTATDVDARALAELSRIAGPHPARAPIEVRRVAAAEPGLEPRSYDRILLAQVDHLLADPVDYLRKLRGALTPGGRVAVSNRIQHRARLIEAAADAGYRVVADVSLPAQYAVLLSPEPEVNP
jgi:ubiquinone/menaquinone biosynthesis C-methylase UbiE